MFTHMDSSYRKKGMASRNEEYISLITFIHTILGGSLFDQMTCNSWSFVQFDPCHMAVDKCGCKCCSLLLSWVGEIVLPQFT